MPTCIYEQDCPVFIVGKEGDIRQPRHNVPGFACRDRTTVVFYWLMAFKVTENVLAVPLRSTTTWTVSPTFLDLI